MDIDPSELQKNKEAHIPINADLKHVLTELNEAITDDDLPQVDSWLAQCKEWKEEIPAEIS